MTMKQLIIKHFRVSLVKLSNTIINPGGHLVRVEPSCCPVEFLSKNGACVLYGRQKAVILFRISVTAKERYSSNMTSERM